MKFHHHQFLRLSFIAIAIALPSAHAADITLGSATYTDTQTYNNGTISGPVTFGSGANYTFDSLNLPLAWNRVILNSGAALNVGGNVSVDFSGLSLNGGTLTVGGLSLHDAPPWAGSISDGKQSIEQGDTIINGATLVANQSNANFISFIGSSSHPEWDPALANNLWLGNDGATINSNGYNIGITMAMGNFSGQTGSLTKTGAGTLTLSTNNSYTGGTTVNGGVLEIAGSNSGNSYIRGTVTVNSGAELRYTGGDGTGFGFANKLDTININGGLVNSQQTTHLWGATVNMTGGELRVNNGTSDPGAGQAIQWNQSTVNTSASANTAIISGRVNLRGDGGYTSAVFNVADGSAATDLLVSAAVTDDPVNFGSVGITKNGAGTMELSGANSYTGTTTVNGGKLVISGNISTSNTTVNSGATLGGSGTVGSLTVNSGGFLNPGNSPGILNVNGDYSQAGTLTIEINGLTAGTQHDQVNVDRTSGNGTVSLSGNLSVLFGGGTYAANNLIFILLNDDTEAISGTFTGYAQDAIVASYGGFNWKISYTADSGSSSFTGGNDIALMAIPEPRAALLGGLGLLMLLRRRR
jgi:autotransporter-associated beta strand protein